MPDILIEQALYGNMEAGGFRFLAKSAGFRDEWLAEAERLCAGFGERPAGVACPGAVFAQPLGRGHVAVVQVADQGSDDAGRPGALAFHLLVLPRSAYAGFGGDPFELARRAPPDWQARGELPTLSWLAEPPPPRTVEQIQGILQRYSTESNLLGPAQVLVDGGRLVYERPAPATDLLASLWALLPTRTRCDLWPASFAFGNALRFHAVVVPKAGAGDFPHYVTEQQALDYPEGRYELSLQVAAESGDQKSLDVLFARRSRSDMLRLGLYLLLAVMVLGMLMRLLSPLPAPEGTKKGPPAKEKAAQLDLPPPGDYPTLTAKERRRLAADLGQLAEHLGMPPLALQVEMLAVGSGPSPGGPASLAGPALLADGQLVEPLLAAVDRRLGTPDPQRDPGQLAKLGPPQRQLRALLWKHHVGGYNDPKLNPSELVERLQAAVEEKGAKKEGP